MSQSLPRLPVISLVSPCISLSPCVCVCVCSVVVASFLSTPRLPPDCVVYSPSLHSCCPSTQQYIYSGSPCTHCQIAVSATVVVSCSWPLCDSVFSYRVTGAYRVFLVLPGLFILLVSPCLPVSKPLTSELNLTQPHSALPSTITSRHPALPAIFPP